MKKLVALVVALMFCLSCAKVCTMGRNGADKIAKGMASRWQCDYKLSYDFFVAPVNKYVCKDESKFTVPGVLVSAACSITVELLADYSAQVISDKFKCNFQLVAKDLKSAGGLCSFLSLM